MFEYVVVVGLGDVDSGGWAACLAFGDLMRQNTSQAVHKQQQEPKVKLNRKCQAKTMKKKKETKRAVERVGV